MSRKPVLVALLLSALAAVALAAPAVANASDTVPPNCYKHPITGEIMCPTPTP